MPRTNIAGDWSGESFRLTARLSPVELMALDDLCVAWSTDRSQALRRALRETAAAVARQRCDALLADVPTLSVAELRALAATLSIASRSRMPKSLLRAAVVAALYRRGPSVK